MQLKTVEPIDPNQLLPLLSVRGDGVPIPINRQDVDKVLAVKVTEQEKAKVQAFADYLCDRGWLKDNTFASLFVYIFDTMWTIHENIANEEAKREEAKR